MISKLYTFNSVIEYFKKIEFAELNPDDHILIAKVFQHIGDYILNLSEDWAGKPYTDYIEVSEEFASPIRTNLARISQLCGISRLDLAKLLARHAGMIVGNMRPFDFDLFAYFAYLLVSEG